MTPRARRGGAQRRIGARDSTPLVCSNRLLDGVTAMLGHEPQPVDVLERRNCVGDPLPKQRLREPL
jgi:hypothetical protein